MRNTETKIVFGAVILSQHFLKLFRLQAQVLLQMLYQQAQSLKKTLQRVSIVRFLQAILFQLQQIYRAQDLLLLQTLQQKQVLQQLQVKAMRLLLK